MRDVLTTNSFYSTKYGDSGYSAEEPPRLGNLGDLPLTTKAELVADQEAHPPFGTNLTRPLEGYSRLHHTSGTTGRPLRWLDDPESWQVMLDCWLEVYRAAGVTSSDRIFVAFGFGPFLGFWTAFDAAQQLGALALAGGGMSSRQRLESMIEHQATVLACTPTYALRLFETACEMGLDLASSPLRITIHGGEPGANEPAMKARLEEAFGARCLDHAGATEVGPWGYACGVGLHLHVNEREFVTEVLAPDSDASVEEDGKGIAAGELVLTTLRRIGSPVIRYRTGDYVRLCRRPCPCGSGDAYLEGGVLSRLDDMLIVRGMNIYPSAIENVVRELPEITEFEIRLNEVRQMAELELRIEVEGGEAAAVSRRLERHVHHHLHLRPRVVLAEAGTLPRYEVKARRFRLDRSSG
jgi:phenylacetate-CoA ligase